MNRILLSLFVLLLLNGHSYCHLTDLNGWDNARWGMTIKELSKIYKVKKTSPECFTAQNVKIGDYKYNVHFLFSKLNVLEGIIINISTGWQNGGQCAYKPPTKEQCKNMERILIEQYGPPHKDSSENLFLTGSRRTTNTWEFPSTRIYFSGKPGFTIEVAYLAKVAPKK